MKTWRVAAALALVAGLALSQAPTILGNMLQLGRSTEAALPTSSTAIQGALLFNLDAGAPTMNDGTRWLTLLDTTFDAGPRGGGSSDAGNPYWVDGGTAGQSVTYAYMAIKPRYYFQSPEDGGVALTVGTLAKSDAGNLGLTLYNSYAGQTYGSGLGFYNSVSTDGGFGAYLGKMFQSGASSGGLVAGFDIHAIGLVTSIGPTLGTAAEAIQTIDATSISAYKPYVSYSPTNTNAFGTAHSTGTRLYRRFYFGPGSGTDYISSDGGYIFTPSPLLSQAAAGQHAFAIQTTGASIDLGSGASDRLNSDGTGATSTGWWRPAGFTDAGLPSPVGLEGSFAYNSSSGRLVYSNGSAWPRVNAIPQLSSVYINAATVAGTTYSQETGPAANFIIDAIRFTVSTPGAGGTTNANFRATAGAGNCDCAFACNSTSVGHRIACTGTCTFAASAAMTYSVTSIGDCATGPTLQGNLTVEGSFR